MKIAKILSIGSLLAAAIGLILRSIPAPIRSVRVTSSTTQPAVAHIAILYGNGKRPQNLICNLNDSDHIGSITLNGQTLYAEIPLTRPNNAPIQLEIEAYYRIFGRLVQIIRRF